MKTSGEPPHGAGSSEPRDHDALRLIVQRIKEKHMTYVKIAIAIGVFKGRCVLAVDDVTVQRKWRWFLAIVVAACGAMIAATRQFWSL
jgi:hypothetical protein